MKFKMTLLLHFFIVSHIFNPHNRLSLDVSDNCLLNLRYGNETLTTWGQECEPETPGVPSLILAQDARMELKNKQGQITWTTQSLCG